MHPTIHRVMNSRAFRVADERFTAFGHVALLAIPIVANALVTFERFNTELLGMGAFRQTQTAISIWAMREGGDWFAYQTPVLGAPWTVPFELPLYQWLAALVSMTGLGIEQSMRVVSLAFAVLAILAFFKLLQQAGVAKLVAGAVSAVAFTSPLFLMWSTSGMIESTALFFAIVYAIVCLRILVAEKQSWLNFATLGVVGFLAISIKVTTFFPYLVLAAILVLAKYYAAFSQGTLIADVLRRRLWIAAFVAVNLAVLAAFLALTSFYDHLKEANAISATLTMSALREWNFGALSDRLDVDHWRRLYQRSVFHIFGYGQFIFLALAFWRGARTFNLTSLALIAAALAAPLTFWNLYYVHDYYAVAVAPLIVAGAAIASVRALGARALLLGAPLLALALTFNAQAFERQYAYTLDAVETGAHQARDVIAVAEMVRAATDPGDVIVVYDGSWSSEIAFYARRRAIMMGKRGPEMFRRVLQEGYLLGEGDAVGAVVVCDKARAIWRRQDHWEEYEDVFGALLVHWARVGAPGTCDVYAPGAPGAG